MPRMRQMEPVTQQQPAVDPPRHDAKYSDEVVQVLRAILDPGSPAYVEGPLFDPFAGTGSRLPQLGRRDLTGIEIEPEWAGWSPLVEQGDALNREDYPDRVGAIVTSPCYGNRFADQYLGPKCEKCAGDGRQYVERPGETGVCSECGGSGHDGSGRYGYAISLGRRVSEGSAASLQWGPKYRKFHSEWLRLCAEVLDVGARRLLVNMSDHHRANKRQYVVDWWVAAARLEGFRLVNAHDVNTPRFGHGQNADSKAEAEIVLVFDLLGREVGE